MMMSKHSAPDELILAHATGWLNEPLSLLVETHAALNEESRERLHEMEAIGGVLLDELEPAALREDALDAVLNRIDDAALHDAADGEPDALAAPARPRGVPRDGLELPATLRRYVGEDVSALNWRPLMRGVSEAEIEVGDGGRARLMRIEAGTMVPRHSHRGQEATLVLSGAYRDGELVFAPGDVQLADPEVDHRPQAIGDTPCLCLVVTDAPLRLTGPVGRLLNPFIKL